jgi:hypothetical protein
MADWTNIWTAEPGEVNSEIASYGNFTEEVNIESVLGYVTTSMGGYLEESGSATEAAAPTIEI